MAQINPKWAAFEWLRSVALGEVPPPDIAEVPREHRAKVALEELARLGNIEAVAKVSGDLPSNTLTIEGVTYSAELFKQLGRFLPVGHLFRLGGRGEPGAAIVLEDMGTQLEPLPMLLFCPLCGVQHIDAPEAPVMHEAGGAAPPVTATWTNPPHKSHLCHSCGCIWRPADVPTVGVAAINTRGKADNFDPDPGQG